MLAHPLHDPRLAVASRSCRGSRSGPRTRIGVGLLGGVAVAAAVTGLVAVPDVASGAGTSYTGPPPPIVRAIEGLLGRVGFTCTVQPTQALTCTGKVGPYTITIPIPLGTFSSVTQVVVTDNPVGDPLPQGLSHPLLGFGIGFFQNGSPVTTGLGSVTPSVSGPGIGQGTRLLRVDGPSLQSYPAAVNGGLASFTMTANPNFELATGSTTGATATSPKHPITHGRQR